MFHVTRALGVTQLLVNVEDRQLRYRRRRRSAVQQQLLVAEVDDVWNYCSLSGDRQGGRPSEPTTRQLASHCHYGVPVTASPSISTVQTPVDVGEVAQQLVQTGREAVFIGGTGRQVVTALLNETGKKGVVLE